MRDRYRHWDSVDTRWRDNDIYGHVNNVIHYEYFDTVINRYLIDAGLDIHSGDVVGIAASSSCEYKAPLTFPGTIDAGLVVTRLGTSSVHYEIALFVPGSDEPAAVGTFVHVFVDRSTLQPLPIPGEIRNALEAIELIG